MIDNSIQRVEINQVIENQLPEFVQSESPLFVDFMKQYYTSQEYQGGSINIAENLDRYTKLQTYVGAALTEFTGLSTNTESYSSTIFVDSTKGYPNKYGLLKVITHCQLLLENLIFLCTLVYNNYECERISIQRCFHLMR